MDFLLFSASYVIYPLLLLKNPLTRLKNYKKNRGMDPMTDIKDWLGGYPFEVATFNEIVTFLSRINPKFKLVKFNKVNPGFGANANNELVFKNVK